MYLIKLNGQNRYLSQGAVGYYEWVWDPDEALYWGSEEAATQVLATLGSPATVVWIGTGVALKSHLNHLTDS